MTIVKVSHLLQLVHATLLVASTKGRKRKGLLEGGEACF